MKKILSQIDLQDVQLVSGISMLGYGLYLVYPPAMFITIGCLLISPFIIPQFKAVK